MTDEPQARGFEKFKFFVAARLDNSQDEWTVKQIFTSKQASIDFAYEQTQTAVRCNRPMEWWRVTEHLLSRDGRIIWGCHQVTVKGSQ